MSRRAFVICDWTIKQDHRRIKHLVRSRLGFGNLRTARRTLAGYEAMAMIRKGQAKNTGGRDMQAHATFVAGLFGIGAEPHSLLPQHGPIQTLQHNR